MRRTTDQWLIFRLEAYGRWARPTSSDCIWPWGTSAVSRGISYGQILNWPFCSSGYSSTKIDSKRWDCSFTCYHFFLGYVESLLLLLLLFLRLLLRLMFWLLEIKVVVATVILDSVEVAPLMDLQEVEAYNILLIVGVLTILLRNTRLSLGSPTGIDCLDWFSYHCSYWWLDNIFYFFGTEFSSRLWLVH